MIDFRILYPCRAAASKLRQWCRSLGDTFNQLTGFLYYGQVSGKIGVQHIISPQLSQESDHLPLYKATVSHAELLTQSSPDRWRGTDNYYLVLILHCRLHLRILISLSNTVHRAYIGTLAAVDADCQPVSLLKGICAVHANLIGTNLLTHATFDAFCIITDNTRIILFNRNPDVQRQMLHTHRPLRYNTHS